MPKKKLKKKINKLLRRKNKPRRNRNALKAYVDSSLFKAGFDYNAPIARRTRMPPSSMRIGGNGRNGGGRTGTLTISGRDLVTTLNVSLTAVSGDVLCDLKCNPAALPAARLNVLASMYERYDIDRMVFAFEGAVPTTQSGSLLGYMDYDILEVPVPTGGGMPLIQRASAHAGAHPVHVWDSGLWSYAPDRRMTDLYCDLAAYEPRLTTPGHFILLINDMPTLAGAAIDLGKVYVEYQITFHYPKVTEAASTGSSLWACEFNNTVGTGIATGSGFFGTTVAAAAYSSIGLSSLLVRTDPLGTNAMTITLPAGHFIVTSYHVGGQAIGVGAYHDVPGLATTLTPVAHSYCTLLGPTDHAEPAYFVGTPLSADEGDNRRMQRAEIRVLGSSSPLFFRWDTAPSNPASLSIIVARVPDYPSRGSDMYVDYVRMLSQFRAFTERHSSELRGVGAPMVALVDDVKIDPTAGDLSRAAAASATSTAGSPNPKFRR